MINFIRTNHIQICVPPDKLEEARLFYEDVIDLTRIDRPAFTSKGYWFAIADIQLHLSVEDATPYSKRHTAFEITDAAAARAYLEKYNVEFLEEPEIAGRIRFSFIDPFGNRIELIQML